MMTRRLSMSCGSSVVDRRIDSAATSQIAMALATAAMPTRRDRGTADRVVSRVRRD